MVISKKHLSTFRILLHFLINEVQGQNARQEETSKLAHLADGGQFGEQHLEDGRRQSLLQHLEQLLRLTTHCYSIGQVVHSFLIVS